MARATFRIISGGGAAVFTVVAATNYSAAVGYRRVRLPPPSMVD